MTRGDLSHEQWARLERLLPSSQGKRGRPYKDHRRVINGIRWRERTGAPWRDLPERDGPWQTCYDRFVRWQRRGIWQRILQTLQGGAGAAGGQGWGARPSGSEREPPRLPHNPNQPYPR